MAPIDTFWTTNGTNATNLIEPTQGDLITRQYMFTPASAPGVMPREMAKVDYTSPQVWIAAGLVFPTSSPFPSRPDFNTVTLEQFIGWHSQHQVEYILERGRTAYAPDPGYPLPTPLPAGTRTVHYADFGAGAIFVLGQDGRTIYNLQTLRTADIVTMPLADQEVLASQLRDPDLADQTNPLDLLGAQASLLMVRPRGGESVESVRQEYLDRIDDLVASITSLTNYDPGMRDEFFDGFLNDQLVRLQNYPHLFVEQLNIYKLRLENMALFHENRINDFIDDLEERFLRITQYAQVSGETASTGGLIGGVNALDRNQATPTIGRGLNIFIEMETQLFQIALARAYVSMTGTTVEPIKGRLMATQSLLAAARDTGGNYADFASFLSAQATDITDRINAGTSSQRFLDGPNLIFVLQTFDNYEAEAEAQIKSEDIQQQTKLLEDYSKMQELLNQTLNKFKPVPANDDNDEPPPQEELGFLNLSLVSQLDEEQLRIASMFDTVASATGNTSYHPIEQKKSPTAPGDFRPTVEIAVGGTLTTHPKTVWDALAVNLGEATKIIGQDSQLQMDAINRLSQQKNRNYELGSNVLNKLTDLLRDITS